jgi:hypothetical protein
LAITPFWRAGLLIMFHHEFHTHFPLSYIPLSRPSA